MKTSGIQTQGKQNLDVLMRVQRQQRRKDALTKRPKKPIKNLTPKERDTAIDAMLEWWIYLEDQ